MAGSLKGDLRHLFSKYGTMKGKPSIMGALRILIVKPGVQALLFYRFYHKLYKYKLGFLSEFLGRINYFLNGAEIDPGSEIGSVPIIYHHLENEIII